jgi:hypothetical protein
MLVVDAIAEPEDAGFCLDFSGIDSSSSCYAAEFPSHLIKCIFRFSNSVNYQHHSPEKSRQKPFWKCEVDTSTKSGPGHKGLTLSDRHRMWPVKPGEVERKKALELQLNLYEHMLRPPKSEPLTS